MEKNGQEKATRNDRAIQLFLNGQFKEMRDNLGKSSRIQKLETTYTPMSDSVVSNYDNRSGRLAKNKNPKNMRRLAHIADQE